MESLLPDIKRLKIKSAFNMQKTVPDVSDEDILKKVTPLIPNALKEELNVSRLREMLGPEGLLSGVFNGFEFRPQQINMLEVVATAFNSGQNLIVEAGTGTGKSLAYLLPASFFAQENNCHVVISTNTINLQEQLLKTVYGPQPAASDGKLRWCPLREWDSQAPDPASSDRATTLLDCPNADVLPHLKSKR